jgi:hypothetical protein
MSAAHKSLTAFPAFAWLRECVQTMRSWWLCERHGVPHEWGIEPDGAPICEICGLLGEFVDA